jgi:hypothetical protein
MEGRSGGTRIHTVAKGSIPDPTKFLLAFDFSPGIEFKLSNRIAMLAGAYLNFPLFDVVRDVNWHLTSYGLRLGVQYRR